MRVIANPPTPPTHSGIPVTAHPADRESIAVTWCREIAAAVAAALDVDVVQTTCHLVQGGDIPAPQALHAAFTAAGHPVQITAVWDSPWHEPGFALTVDSQPVPLDARADTRSVVVLAHAAWQAITDAQRATAEPAGAGHPVGAGAGIPAGRAVR